MFIFILFFSSARVRADSRLRPQGKGGEGRGGEECVRTDAPCPRGRAMSVRTLDCVRADVVGRLRGHARVRADASVLSQVTS
jgi:hypothetical protein